MAQAPEGFSWATLEASMIRNVLPYPEGAHILRFWNEVPKTKIRMVCCDLVHGRIYGLSWLVLLESLGLMCFGVLVLSEESWLQLAAHVLNDVLLRCYDVHDHCSSEASNPRCLILPTINQKVSTLGGL